MNNIKLAQIFYVGGSYTPTKISLYLKRLGTNLATSFVVDESCVLDACNFSNLEQQACVMNISSAISDYTGNGYMYVTDIGIDSGSASYPVLSYPISVVESGSYNVYLRVLGTGTSVSADILLDDQVVASESLTVTPNTWSWMPCVVSFADTISHTVGIRLKEKGSCLDEICISKDVLSFSPTDKTLDYTISPFVTVHAQIYSVNIDMTPNNPLLTYAYKNTLVNIIHDGWVNFDLTGLDSTSSISYTDDYYAIVLFSAGGYGNNDVIWDMVDVDEYSDMPSAILVN